MIKVNVILNNISWKKHLKNPNNFIGKKIALFKSLLFFLFVFSLIHLLEISLTLEVETTTHLLCKDRNKYIMKNSINQHLISLDALGLRASPKEPWRQATIALASLYIFSPVHVIVYLRKKSINS